MDNPRDKLVQSLNDGAFEEYLKSEYSNIAQAHFTTIDTISAFFRYYLLIMSIPISLIAVLLTVIPGGAELTTTLVKFGPVLAVIFFAISFAGIGVMLYITSLRMDVILYARVVNAIRKHFYDGASIDLATKLHTRVLPQTPSRPSYAEWHYFGPVIACFAILNTSYFVLAFFALQIASVGTFAIPPWWVWPIVAVFFGSHLRFYTHYANHREHAYLRSNILGVDIDGVLNQHRTHFCDLLKQNTDISIDPNNITLIPVHENSELNVSRDEERKVFNDPKYWINMPVVDGAEDNLKRIRNAFNLKIFIFTHRPWPITADMNPQEKGLCIQVWKEKVLEFSRQVRERAVRSAVVIPLKIRFRPMEEITKLWLRQYGITYDRLVIEKASADISDPQTNFKNRFHICRKKNIRFFVEDDLIKAVKLAYICDVVFLFDQPYNQNGRILPSNIVRVKSWDEIYKEIRRLS